MALCNIIIERTFPRLAHSGAKSNEAPRQPGPDVRWLESFVAADKTFRVYLATNEDMIREHAEIGGFPATEHVA
jgi:hypothetical protein